MSCLNELNIDITLLAAIQNGLIQYVHPHCVYKFCCIIESEYVKQIARTVNTVLFNVSFLLFLV